MSYQEARLVSYTDITPDVRLFQFSLTDEHWSFEPGQHTVLRFEQDGSQVERPYTPVTLPGTKMFGLAIKKYEEGTASVWMHNREIGDKIEFKEPQGNLKLRSLSDDVVLISTGTGATPMYAMLREYLKKGEGSVDYIHGEKTHEDLMFEESLRVLESENKNLNVEFSLTREEWSGRTGYVQNHLQDIVRDLENKTFYICGVPSMVVATEDRLKDLGVDETNIITEGWENDAA